MGPSLEEGDAEKRIRTRTNPPQSTLQRPREAHRIVLRIIAGVAEITWVVVKGKRKGIRKSAPPPVHTDQIFYQILSRHPPMWPQFIIDSFQRVPANAEENEYYGPWNSVLNYCFRIEEGYEITPQKVVGGISSREKDSIDFVVSYTITKNTATIFFVEVKPQKSLPGLYLRQEADDQVRKRFTQLYNSSPSVMHGVSAFGSHCSFYLFDKGTGKITPARAAQPSPDFVVDVAPLVLWNHDILQEEGYERFLEIVASAKMVGLGERMFRI
jgi:hypothetical protein